MIKVNFPHPPSCLPSSFSLPFKSGCECHDAKSSLHLRAGQEATTENDGEKMCLSSNYIDCNYSSR